jgi:glycosyltransferase involved in cell wall biosynthesis
MTDPATDASVLFLCTHSSSGGVQEVWANLADSFHDLGIRVKLVALYPLPGTVSKTSSRISWSYVVPNRPSSPLALAHMMRALIAMLKREQATTVFTAMPMANVLVPLAVRLGGLSTKVVTSHHTPVDTYNRVLDRADAVTGSMAAVKTIVSVSNAVAASLDGKSTGYRAKRRTIHNALPPHIEQLLGDLDKAQAPRVARGRTVVATGRLAPQKNYPLLIRSARHLDAVSINIVGIGPDQDMLATLARDQGVEGKIHFLGHHPREEALAIVAAGDVFAQVSLFEGHSLALIEAAKLALPLVVSDVPAQTEGITASDGTRCGIVVGADDDAALAHEIARLLDEPDYYAAWSERSRRLGEEATYARMVAAYRTLAA